MGGWGGGGVGRGEGSGGGGYIPIATMSQPKCCITMGSDVN